MRIAVTGSHGLIGSALTLAAGAHGWRVHPVVRSEGEPGGDAIPWNPREGFLDPARLEGMDAVVNLAGANLAQGRWTAERKRELVTSRVPGTELLAGALARLERKPGVLVSASAIGWYGDRGETPLDESSPRGRGFLADLCDRWERATGDASDAGIRVVHARTGLVLSPLGGALRAMLPLFRAGLGGPLGSGHQVWSWIAIQDVVRALLFAIETPALSGPVNLTAPGAVSNAEFARTLGRVLSRPAFLPAPAFALRLGLGEMSDMVLTGQRVVPSRLLAQGFEFRHPALEEALRSLFVARAELTTRPAA